MILIFCAFWVACINLAYKHLSDVGKTFLGIYRNNKHTVKRPLKPIIITRDAIQKEIFGMGYKNVPVMSIEEFYEDRARKVDNIQDLKVLITEILG